MEDGVPLRLNGTLITQEFRARGFDVPPNVLPAEIDMKIPGRLHYPLRYCLRCLLRCLICYVAGGVLVPVDEVVDMRKLIAATVDGSAPLSAYARATRCPYSPAIRLGSCYAMPGTEREYAATRIVNGGLMDLELTVVSAIRYTISQRTCYEMPGTDVAAGTICWY
eukprot:1245986-Rhodomonas_salina.4